MTSDATPRPAAHDGGARARLGRALGGRHFTHDEEAVHLFHVAKALGSRAARAMELRGEVARETRSGVT